jgi:penicillin amidase
LKKILVIAGVLFVAVAAFVLGVFFWARAELKGSLPEVSGQFVIEGISQSVDIYRDEYGIPHIYSENREDLMFAVGFVSAQDRLWQMDVTRRAATGRLAEIFGEGLIAADLLARTIGFEQIAKQQVEILSADTLALAEAYSSGVNACIKQTATLPLEFRLLKYEPEPWQPSDSHAISRLLAWQLSKNYKSELIMLRLESRLDSGQAAQLGPAYPAGGPFIMQPEFRVEPIKIPYFDKGARLLDEVVGTSGGSNCWVIGPSLTETGAPILANDPHLSGTRVPSIWYFVHMVGGGFDVIGGLAPGLPIPLLGHNRRIGWGITNMNADVQDVFIERLNPDNQDQYEYDGEWLDMEMRVERIDYRSKDGEQAFIEKIIHSTKRGPLITGISPGTVKAVSLSWTGYEPTPDFEALVGLNLAADWEDFIEALETFAVAPQNFIYADVDGNIGYCGAGKIPIRPSGDGSVPQAGWTSETEWKGYVPFEEMPRTLNPSAGYIITANNKVVPDSYKHFLSAQWAPPYRYRRIAELIESNNRHDVQAVAQMQLDAKSLLAGSIIINLTPALNDLEDPRLIKAVSYLKQWNFVNTTDSIAATIYHEFFLKLAKNTFQKEMGKELTRAYLDDYYLWLERFVEILKDENSHWFDASRTEESETRSDIVVKSFEEAITSLERNLGTDMEEWEWGRVHRLEFGHPIARDAITKRLFNLGPYPFPGDGETVNRGTFAFNKPYDVTMAASIRHIMDFSQLNRSLGIHTTGQSGHPASKHYGDFVEKWLNGECVTMMMDRTDYIDNIEGHLRLSPLVSESPPLSTKEN